MFENIIEWWELRYIIKFLVISFVTYRICYLYVDEKKIPIYYVLLFLRFTFFGWLLVELLIEIDED